MYTYSKYILLDENVVGKWLSYSSIPVNYGPQESFLSLNLKLMIGLVFLLLVKQFSSTVIVDTNDYTTWTIPDKVSDVQTVTKPGAALIGGGRDCIPAFEWQIQNANRGDYLILRASGDDSYNDFVYGLSVQNGIPLNSVTTILFKNGNASYNEQIQSILLSAEAIFFAGGDQSLYLNYWMGTPIQSIIQNKLKDITISGTSAGLAIQGNWIYSAAVGTLYSDEAMENPYNQYVTIAPSFLKIPFLNNVITDTHFTARDRMGRMLTFLGRIMTDSSLSPNVHAIGIDETTALLLDVNDGSVTTVGTGNGYLCSPTQLPAVCKPEMTLTVTDISCVRLNGPKKETFSLAKWTGEGMPYTNSIANGKFTTSKYGP
eukprot:gene13297-17816_t